MIRTKKYGQRLLPRVQGDLHIKTTPTFMAFTDAAGFVPLKQVPVTYRKHREVASLDFT